MMSNPHVKLGYARLETHSRWKNLPPPTGFTKSASFYATAPSRRVTNNQASYDDLKAKRAWDVALAPLKSLPMQAFMLYMSGGGVQIFSIGIVFVLLLSPFRNLAGINEAFAQYAPSSKDPKSITSLPLQKLVYIICNLLTLAVGLWKCRSMGLLPIGTGDWLAFESRNLPTELSLL